MNYSTLQMKLLLVYYIEHVCTDPKTRYTMRISSFLEWLSVEDKTKHIL